MPALSTLPRLYMEERKEILHVGLLTSLASMGTNKGRGDGHAAPP